MPTRLILLAGPTATGKTALAVELARRLDGEVISADSMQVYRGCAIGAAQPTAEELGAVAYHLVSFIEPNEEWSVADWLRAARALVGAIHARGKTAIIAGGTGLYFKAWTEGVFEAPGAQRHPEIRRRLEAEWEADGGRALRRRLEEVDPQAARRIKTNDRVRVVRALEVYEATGRSITRLQEEARRRHRPPAAHRFVLYRDRADLYRRIDARVLDMIRRGFLEEVRNLLARGAQDDWPAMRALGYAQLARHLRGEISLEQAVEETQRASRRYAKYQMILFRKWRGALWLDASDGVDKNARDIEKTLESRGAAAF